MCVLLLELFQDDSRYFSPHQVNHGGVQRPLPQVSLYKSHMTEESLRRRRSGRYSQVLPGHLGHARKPHQRVCVVGHLLRGISLVGESLLYLLLFNMSCTDLI